ncbi:hypothetical protein [Frigoribacterium sp. CG_9.8]|uniref:hypothetical protein n=1 Tax=Frigoribacterium sp. CG_9.8 TaxID=2787733 RepID=UPI0018CA5EC3|nr:hypothetical protein [Frigoribacterium sp. CG_9.8]MBG6106752.1 hypothetical protein [Frigoribacterium sp. CG_9.8]
MLSIVPIAVVAAVLAMPTAAQAATGGDFNAGAIISDAVFYYSNAMTASQIQGFIDAKESCVFGSTCLENFRQDTVSRAADAKCGAYTGVAGQRASDIVYAVAQACGVNPQVLLVLLEKEQGLVTSSSPSASRYNIATGYACPDTAPCDAQYYGFYNQVYRAAWQYQTYRLLPTSFSYRAGRVNNIQWNPNSACGSSPVYIENQATAGLYIYTPYQPNAAALANLYGVGDSCSSYGNRNFWRIFSNWFGNPQGGGSFAKTADNSTIYLLTADHKYAVPNGELLNAYYALGPYRTVTAAYLSQFITGNTLGQLVRDPTTGEIFYFDLGVKHHVASCAQLVDYNSSCSSYIDLMPTQILALTSGADLTQFARSAATGAIYYLSGGKKSWVRSMSDVLRLNNGTTPDFINLGPTALATLADGPDILSPGTYVKLNAQQTVYLVDGQTKLVPVPSSSLGSDFSSESVMAITDVTLAAYSIARVPLTPMVTCGGATYLAGGGQLWLLAANVSFGLPLTALDASTCSALTRAPLTVSGALFVRSPATGAIYYVTGGQKSHLSTMAAVASLNGGISPTLVPVGDATLTGMVNARELLGPTQLVKSAGSDVVYFIDGLSRKVPIDLFETANQFGVSGYSTIDDATLNNYTAVVGNLSIIVSCGTTTNFVAGGGKLWALPTGANIGLPTTALDALTCASVPKSAQAVSGVLFVRSPTTGAIYVLADGKKSYMSSMDAVYAANGGTQPVFVPVATTVLAKIAG